MNVCYCSGQSLEDESSGNFQNVVCVKYISDITEYPIKYFMLNPAIVTNITNNHIITRICTYHIRNRNTKIISLFCSNQLHYCTLFA
jgi:hypothetical protein